MQSEDILSEIEAGTFLGDFSQVDMHNTVSLGADSRCGDQGHCQNFCGVQNCKEGKKGLSSDPP